MGEIRIKSGNLYQIEMKDDAWITFHGGQIISRSDNVLQVLTSDSEQASGVYTGSLRQLSTLSDTVSMSADICCDNPNAKLLIGFERDGKLLSETSCTSEFQHYEVNNFTFSKEQNFIVYCFNKQTANIYIKNLMINLGSTALPYEPYFLNRPAHQVVNGQFVDIPTHHFINGRWQGELTSQSPLKFWADREMLDWRIEGASGGVGDWDETEQRYRIPVTVNGTTTNLFTDHQLMDGDSIDYATTETQIPIATGNNTLTVDTAVQPSKVFVKFEG